jgi:NAD(P)-dependent dehydrogenase (short-subunit alcohol dehydrogenase family)
MDRTDGAFRLAGKTAVITGGTTGLGYATADRFLAEGAAVLITGRNDDRVRAAVQELGRGIVGFRADVRSLLDLEMLAATTRDTFSDGIDVLFANAGVGTFRGMDAVDEADFHFQFDVNVKGVFFTVQKLLPQLRPGASVILHSSAVSEKGLVMSSVYAATKAAVRSFARSFAAELGPKGIRVNAISPGLIPTAFQTKMGAAAETLKGFEGFVTQAAPLGRVGRPDEVAAAALFLASDESSYLTAADLLVDGGYMNV